MKRGSQSRSDNIAIRRWADIAERERLLPELEAIFFEASGTNSFASEADKKAFRERWLGRYLEHDPEWVHLAFDPNDTLAGYLIGSLDDPARTARFGDIGYFKDFSALTLDYPAHLHVNLAPAYRNLGIGAKLIDTFAAAAARAGAPGVHVVTGTDARNTSFYARTGFRELGRARSNSNEVVFLGRGLFAAETA
ncbi:MAG: GNAT family N-acetyltransferase [Hyphomicrobium sp.]